MIPLIRNQILSIQTWSIPMVFFASSHFAVESQLRTFTSGNFALSHLRPKGVRGSNETPCLPMPFVRVWNYHHKNILELTVSAWYLLWLDWLQVYFLSGCIKYYIYLVLNIFSHSFFKKSECVHTTTDGTKSQTVQPVLSIRTSWKCHQTLNLPVNLHSF